jgi:hypothetical protein
VISESRRPAGAQRKTCFSGNAARAQQLPQVVMVGHLTDLASIRRTFGLVAKFYGATILTPEAGGSATALGALLTTEQMIDQIGQGR